MLKSCAGLHVNICAIDGTARDRLPPNDESHTSRARPPNINVQSQLRPDEVSPAKNPKNTARALPHAKRGRKVAALGSV